MGTETEQSTQVHGGRLVARRLKAHGVTKLFTLSGGHLFSIYDGCRAEGIDLVDTRHEQSAAFAAEGWAKVTRQPGVAALTAGPGVTNGMSALGSAQQNGSPLVVLGGRAPAMRWGQGSLQEVDHVPFVAPLTKSAVTAQATSEIPGLIDDALRTSLEPHPGPAFVDFPLDVVFMEAPGGEDEASLHDPAAEPAADGPDLDRAVALLRGAERPVIMAGTGLWWGHGERALRALAEELRVPVFLNGLARGVVPADHELFFSRARGTGLQGADVALVVGVPMDFRLAFGQAFGADTELIVVDRAPAVRPHPRPVAAELLGGIGATLDALREGVGAARPTQGWVDALRTAEDEKRAAEQAQLGDGRSPLHPVRLYKELGEVLDRNAVVVGDGGDFVSYAGRFIDSYEPGCWLDPGPFGCLAPAPATRWPRSSPTPIARSCCCSATGPSASAGWSTTRWPGTASTSSGSWATTASGRSRSTRWSSSTATPSRPSCDRGRATTGWSRRSAATASSSSAPRTSRAPSSAPSPRVARRS